MLEAPLDLDEEGVSPLPDGDMVLIMSLLEQLPPTEFCCRINWNLETWLDRG